MGSEPTATKFVNEQTGRTGILLELELEDSLRGELRTQSNFEIGASK